MANTLKKLINLQEEMTANFNNFLRVERTHTKRKSTILNQYVNTPIKITRLINNISTFVTIFDQIYVFQTKFVLILPAKLPTSLPATHDFANVQVD